MPTARLLASYTADEAEKSQAQESAARKDSDYFSTDGDIIDLKTILRDENRTLAGTLIHRSDLFDLQQSGKLQGNLKPSTESPIEWDHVVFDLSSYGDQAVKAHEIIRDTFRSPSYTATKNQGGGRFQTMQIKGKRGVIDWGVHKNREDGLTHSHLFIHRYVVDKDTRRICPPVNLQSKLLANAELEQVNRALLTHGLAPLESLDLGISQTRTQTMPKSDQYEAAQAGVNAVLSGTDTMQVLQSATASPVAVGIIGELKGQELLSRGLDAARSAAAAAAEQYKAAAERAAQIEVALQAIQTAKILEQKLSTADAKIAEQEVKMGEAVDLLDQQTQQIENQTKEIEELLSKVVIKDANIDDLKNKVTGLEDDYQNITEELDAVVVERDQLVNSKTELENSLKKVSEELDQEKSIGVKLENQIVSLNVQYEKEYSTHRENVSKIEVEKTELRDLLDKERQARQSDWSSFDKSLNQITAAKDQQISTLNGINDLKDQQINSLAAEVEKLKKQLQTQTQNFAAEFQKLKMQQIKGQSPTPTDDQQDDDAGSHKGQTGG